MDEKKTICFHGTNKANAGEIRNSGFRKDTFFAKHLEDALGYGGCWIFEVCFDSDKLPPGCWQFRTSEEVPHSSIVSLRHYAGIERIFENADLRQQIFELDLLTQRGRDQIE